MDLHIHAINGVSKVVSVPDDKYWMVASGSKFALSHDFLLSMADELGSPFDAIETEKVSDHVAITAAGVQFQIAYKAFVRLPDGRYFEELGEANPANLDVGKESTLSLKYPETMAHKRAVDRLIIRLLGIKDQVYSDSEISKDDLKAPKAPRASRKKEDDTPAASAPTTPPAIEATTPAAPQAPTTPAATTPSPEAHPATTPDPASASAPAADPDPEPAPSAHEPTADPTDPRNILIPSGVHENKTLGQVLDIDRSYIEKFADYDPAKYPSRANFILACRALLAS